MTLSIMIARRFYTANQSLDKKDTSIADLRRSYVDGLKARYAP